MISTPICDILGIRYPIFQGGMAWISDGKLAGAVSEAGGLGIISAMNADADPDEVADALRDMQREAWRIDRREARHTLSLDAMGTSVASTGPESDPGIALMRRCRTDELAAALSRLPAVQLRRLLMHAVAQLPVREIARREGCSERAVKYSLAKARKRMKGILSTTPGPLWSCASRNAFKDSLR